MSIHVRDVIGEIQWFLNSTKRNITIAEAVAEKWKIYEKMLVFGKPNYEQLEIS